MFIRQWGRGRVGIFDILSPMSCCLVVFCYWIFFSVRLFLYFISWNTGFLLVTKFLLSESKIVFPTQKLTYLHTYIHTFTCKNSHTYMTQRNGKNLVAIQVLRKNPQGNYSREQEKKRYIFLPLHFFHSSCELCHK